MRWIGDPLRYSSPRLLSRNNEPTATQRALSPRAATPRPTIPSPLPEATILHSLSCPTWQHSAPLQRSQDDVRSGDIPERWPRRDIRRWTRESAALTKARLEDAGSGLAPVTEGWFVVNVGDAEWFSSDTRGAACWFANEYGKPPIEFPQLGINVTVLEPGQSGVYHAEANQEAFLILAGECRLLVEAGGLLRAWDFFHSPPGRRMPSGAADAPCVSRWLRARKPEVRLPVSGLAALTGASVEKGLPIRTV